MGSARRAFLNYIRLSIRNLDRKSLLDSHIQKSEDLHVC